MVKAIKYEPPTGKVKTCYVCHQGLDLCYFPKDKGNPDGRMKICKQCRSDKRRDKNGNEDLPSPKVARAVRANAQASRQLEQLPTKPPAAPSSALPSPREPRGGPSGPSAAEITLRTLSVPCPPHYWVLDSAGQGKCSKCDSSKSFANVYSHPFMMTPKPLPDETDPPSHQPTDARRQPRRRSQRPEPAAE